MYSNRITSWTTSHIRYYISAIVFARAVIDLSGMPTLSMNFVSIIAVNHHRLPWLMASILSWIIRSPSLLCSFRLWWFQNEQPTCSSNVGYHYRFNQLYLYFLQILRPPWNWQPWHRPYWPPCSWSPWCCWSLVAYVVGPISSRWVI